MKDWLRDWNFVTFWLTMQNPPWWIQIQQSMVIVNESIMKHYNTAIAPLFLVERYYDQCVRECLLSNFTRWIVAHSWCWCHRFGSRLVSFKIVDVCDHICSQECWGLLIVLIISSILSACNNLLLISHDYFLFFLLLAFSWLFILYVAAFCGSFCSWTIIVTILSWSFLIAVVCFSLVVVLFSPLFAVAVMVILCCCGYIVSCYCNHGYFLLLQLHLAIAVVGCCHFCLAVVMVAFLVVVVGCCTLLCLVVVICWHGMAVLCCHGCGHFCHVCSHFCHVCSHFCCIRACDSVRLVFRVKWKRGPIIKQLKVT